MKTVIINDYIRGRVSNENTLWSVLSDNIPNAIGISLEELDIPLQQKLDEIKPDIIIQNANLGNISDYPTISFLQDPLIEMQKYYESSLVKLRVKLRGRELYYPKVIQKQTESLANNIKVTNSWYMADLYKQYGFFQVVSMGVDTELFRPMNQKEMRQKYGIPLDKKVNIFVGSTHQVKGWNEIKKMIADDSNVFWILVLKDKPIPSKNNYKVYNNISQYQLAELYNCADKLVSKSKTESFGLAMVEAMMCDVPVSHTSTGVFWDWNPDMIYPRKQALEHGLGIKNCIINWQRLLERTQILNK